MSTTLSRRSLFTAVTAALGAALVTETVTTQPAAATPGNAASVQLMNPPFRIQDTRDPGGAKLAGGHTLEVFVPGLIGQGVVGVLLNLTVTNTEGGGFVRIDASNSPGTNTTSNLNWWTTGLTLANLVTIPAEGTRGIVVTAGGTGRADIVIDLVGFLTNP
jgi:hypothetical protein